MKDRENSKAMRISMASSRPSLRAFGCWSSGSFPARMEMKMMLSMPSTISRPVRVRKPIQACGSVSKSMALSQV